MTKANGSQRVYPNEGLGSLAGLPDQFWQFLELFSSNCFQTGQHVGRPITYTNFARARVITYT